MTGATAAPLNQILEPSACWATYRRTNTKPLRRSFSLPFSPSRWPSRRRVTQHAASHSLAVPAPIGDHIRALAPGAHTTCTQLSSLGVPKSTLIPWYVCVCVCVSVCLCLCVCMYVCVCVIYVLLNLLYFMIHIILNYLHLLCCPFSAPDILLILF